MESATSASITLSGLSIGTQYQIQFFADSTASNSQTITSAGTMDSENGQYVKGTFTANATSLVLTVTRNTAFAVANALTIGTVETVSQGVSYDNWVSNYPTLTNTAATVDFDKGGLPTGIERVLGGNPTTSSDDASIAPTLAAVSGNYVFTYRRSHAAYADVKTTIAVEYSSDFINWTTATSGGNISIDETNDAYGSGIDQVRVTFMPGAAVGGKVFVRLKAVVNP
jgi:hypothetical protein